MEKIPHVYTAINEVMAAISKTGITKDRKTTSGSIYNFRGIDDVYNVMNPLLVAAGLVAIPRHITRDCVERPSKNGGVIFYTNVFGEVDFISMKDGSKHTASGFGEAMDSSDKSTNKAMSALFKYVFMQTFCIPTEADNDTENTNHEVAVIQDNSQQKATPVKKESAAEFKRSGKTDEWIAMLDGCKTIAQILETWLQKLNIIS